MLFSKLSTALWGFSTVAFASPLSHNGLAARDTPAKQGLFWTPRSLQRPNGRGRRKDIIVAQPIGAQPNAIQIGQDRQLVEIIGNLIEIEGLDDTRDIIRRNHYRNRNRRDDVNTVIIVVVVVVDNRDQRNRNLRYLTRHVEANPGAAKQEWVVVTEHRTLTVDNVNPTAIIASTTATTTTTPVAALPTGVAVPAVGVFDPNAPLVVGTQDALLPARIEAPRYEQRGARRDHDPALIIVADQAVFVIVNGDDGRDDRHDDRGRDRDDRDREHDDRLREAQRGH